MKYMLMLAAMVANAAEFFASPEGTATGNGSKESPWTIAAALAHPSALKPGDTLYLRGGTYAGQFRSTLAGNANAPIVVRSYGFEKAVFDGALAPDPNQSMRGALLIQGQHTWYRDFEVTNSYPTRIYERARCSGFQWCRGPGIDVLGPGVKLINLVIHDTSDAVGLWTPAVDAEVNGCIIYNIGHQTETRGNGMGIYAQNDTGVKRIINNIVFNGLHSGIHVYGTSQSALRNIVIEGNTIFQNGMLAREPNGWGILVGGNVEADTIAIRNNYFWNPKSFTRSSNLNPSWGIYGANNLTVTGNESTGFRSIEYSSEPTNATVTGNRFYGVMNDIARPLISATDNEVSLDPPATVRVYQQASAYEPGKSHVTVFNGTPETTVRVVPAGLSPGDLYEVRDVQNLTAPPVLMGVYDGGGLALPLTRAEVMPTVGTVPRTPVSTGTMFGVFVVRRFECVRVPQ